MTGEERGSAQSGNRETQGEGTARVLKGTKQRVIDYPIHLNPQVDARPPALTATIQKKERQSVKKRLSLQQLYRMERYLCVTARIHSPPLAASLQASRSEGLVLGGRKPASPSRAAWRQRPRWPPATRKESTTRKFEGQSGGRTRWCAGHPPCSRADAQLQHRLHSAALADGNAHQLTNALLVQGLEGSRV